MKLKILSAIILLFALGCGTGESSKESPAEEDIGIDESADNDDISAVDDEPETSDTYAPQTVDDDAAEWITGLLESDYLRDDMDYLEDMDRKFQFFKVDLNDDGENEYFVRFMSPWFCGSGGCTFYLLSNEGEMITSFTVTTAPIYVEPTEKNGWSVLLVKDRGVLRELVYENGSYPSNPTVLPEAPYDAPSGHALVMFDEEFGKAKTYTF